VALLKSLRNSSKPAHDLRHPLTRYPEVIKVLNSIEPDIKYKIFDFSKTSYTAEGIDDVVEFTKKTGLLAMLCQMESAIDYLLGVEVGLDTNARKNRSGLFLEKMVREAITELVGRHPDIKWLEQKSFKHVESEFGVSPPRSLRDRKFDHVVIAKGKATNIEVNFYGGTGSKPGEIVRSYINRGEVL